MSNRTDIELALDVRSDERIAVICSEESTYEYPESWVKPESLSQLQGLSVVVIDRVEIQKRTLAHIAACHPRLVAFAVANVEHEKQVRRMLTGMFPWSEVWTISTAFGKLLVTKDVVGAPYDRDAIVDERINHSSGYTQA